MQSAFTRITGGVLSAMAVGFVAAMAAPAAAQDATKIDKVVVTAAKDIPIEQWFRRAEFSQMALSGDGKKLAAVSPIKGRGNLVVIDLDKRTRTIITSFESFDVAQFRWVSNNRIWLRVADGQEVTGRQTYRGSYFVDADGSNLRDVTRIGQRNVGAVGSSSAVRAVDLQVIRPVGGEDAQTDELFVTMSLRSGDSSDVYKFNSRTGAHSLVSFDSPGRVSRWLLDRAGVPRAARREETDNNTTSIWVRDSEGAPWTKIHSTAWSEPDLLPLAFDWDGNTMYVATNIPTGDRMGIYKYDVKSRKLGDKVYDHPLVDVDGGLLFDTVNKKLAGVRFAADKPQHIWFDEEMAKIQAQIDATFPDHSNTIASTPDRKKMLITSTSDQNPGAFYLYDAEKKALEALPTARPWIKPELMAKRQFIKYKARDGMEIPAYLTLPPHKEGKNLPLIMHVHGGPQVRGYYWQSWGRWPDAQFLASRGYAVLEPEPRISDGFGLKHLRAGMREWGLKMQDDINDGALHLVKQGVVDKNRMCIYGASYGGYAAAMGIVRDPDFWKCGNASVAVTDTIEFITTPMADYSETSNYTPTSYFYRGVGDASTDEGRKKLREASPFLRAATAKAPLMLTMGSDDRRVPLVQGERMRDAMEKAGKTVIWKVYAGEGHGFNKDENVIDFYRRTEAFFAEHLKP